MNQEKFSVANMTKGKLPSLPFVRMKDAVLGTSYELSLAVIGDKRMASANKTYRNKKGLTDILSFELEPNSGEILLHLKTATQKARERNMSVSNYIGFLFIHGLLHLKGRGHGSIMEREEQAFCTKFGIIIV